MIGKSVVDTAAMNIGKIKDVVVNINDWNVVYILVKIPRPISKEFGIGGLMGAIARVTPDYIEKIGDLVKLNVEALDLIQNVEID